MSQAWYLRPSPPRALDILLYMQDGPLPFARLSERSGWGSRTVVLALKKAVRAKHVFEETRGGNRQEWVYSLTYLGREKVLELAELFEGRDCLRIAQEAIRLGRPPAPQEVVYA